MTALAATRIGIDVGGTFTDLVAPTEGGLVTVKVPSVPRDQSVGVVDALEQARIGGPAVLAHGMTVATNALLERRGARTALVTTEGFADVIEIGRQARQHLYDLSARRPPPLVPRELRFTVRERVGPAGVLVPLDDDDVRHVVEQLAAAEVTAVAVCLLFSFVHPQHEQAVGHAIRAALPGVHVSLSSEVLPEFREYERTSTTVADAFLAPELTGYLSNLLERLESSNVRATYVMQSSGGVTSVTDAVAQPAGCVLSGPAGGVVGAARAAAAVGLRNVLTLDIGGTSADVATIVDGEVVTTTERAVAGVDIRLPMLDVHTISAGGGSIVWIDDGGALRVGPRSAGASPGPACYQRGGTRPTVTDALVVLGYIPDGGSLGGAITLSKSAAEGALEPVAERLDMSVQELAVGVLRVTNHAVAQALRKVTVERGLDPRDFGLVAFGGAGGLHACLTAEELDVATVVIPPAAGVLSALGLSVADLRLDASRAFVRELVAADAAALATAFEELERSLLERLPGARLGRRADLRYRGQAHELTVDADDFARLASRFHVLHERRHGYAVPDEPIELVALRVTATQPAPPAPEAPRAAAAGRRTAEREAVFGGIGAAVPVVVSPGPGEEVDGPAIVEYADSTCVVPRDWHGTVHDSGALVLRRAP